MRASGPFWISFGLALTFGSIMDSQPSESREPPASPASPHPAWQTARTAGGHLAGATWAATKSFVLTFLLFLLVGVVCAAVSWSFLRGDHWGHGLAVAVLALVEAIVLGVVLGGKRAIAAAVVHGITTLRLGGKLVAHVFDRMLGIVDGTEFGERGGTVGQSIERLPIAQADSLLTRAVESVLGEASHHGLLRRAIHTRLLRMIQRYTLARFREEGARHGGVNLKLVRDELVGTVDDLIATKLRGGLRLWTALAAVGLPVVVALQTWGYRHWLDTRPPDRAGQSQMP